MCSERNKQDGRADTGGFRPLNCKEVEKMLYYLTNADYCILGGLLLLVSLLIANTYSKYIFSKSAMKSFREEV